MGSLTWEQGRHFSSAQAAWSRRRQSRGILPWATRAGFLAALAALACMGVLAVQSGRNLSERSLEVNRTLQVLGTADRLLSRLVDAETGQRGYLLVSEEQFLEPYVRARQEVESDLQGLGRLISADEAEASRFRDVERLSRLKMEELARTIALGREGRMEEARQSVRSGRGKAIMDEIRAHLGALTSQAESRLVERTEQLRAAGRRNTAVLVTGTVFLGLLTLGAANLARKDFFTIQRHAGRLETLHQIDAAIIGAASERKIGELALSALQGLTGASHSTLQLASPAGQTHSLARGQDTQGAGQTLQLPLSTPRGSPGLLTLTSAPGEKFDKADEQVARELVTLLAIAFEQGWMREQLKGEAARLETQVAERTRALNEANEELEAFSYSVSHDLRAPLRSIEGFSQSIEDDTDSVLSERSRRFFSKVRRASTRMGELIDDLLRLSRVSRAELRRHDVDLSAVCGEVCEQLRGREPNRRIEPAIQPGMSARADPALVRIALENLLGNAWKFTSGRALAHVRVGTEEAEGTRVYFVQDDGAGFDLRYADKLFSPFQRLHSERDFPGTGIGLAIVSRIIRRHGGKIWARSAPDEGATFYFTLDGSRSEGEQV